MRPLNFYVALKTDKEAIDPESRNRHFISAHPKILLTAYLEKTLHQKGLKQGSAAKG
jgi:hypothetical protein